MIRRNKAVLLAALTAVVVALFLFSLIRESGTDVTILEKELCLAHMEGLSYRKGLIRPGDQLLCQGKPLPYDAGKNCYYLPCQNAMPELTWTNGRQQVMLEEAKNLEQMRRTGEALTLYVYESSAYETRSLVLTGLPAISIQMESDTSTFGPYDEVIAAVNVFDPDATGAYQVTSAQARLSHRGASSRYFAKKSYNLRLYDSRGEDSGYPLLGLRQDNRWILKSLFTDPNRIREKLALGIWAELVKDAPINPPCAEMAFCEVFLDDGYLGLYALMTPVDPVDMGLDADREILYKATSFDILTEPESAYPKRELKANGIRFPELWREELWDGMLWYVKRFYKEEPAESLSELTGKLELENFIDYALFHTLVSARDNNFSNTFYLTRYDADGQYRILKFPWDLDMTFGNKWSGGWPDMSAFDAGTMTEVSFPHDMNVTLEQFDEAITPLIQARYATLRESVFNRENLIGTARTLMDTLTDSGAIYREQARWPEMTIHADVTEIETYLEEHLTYLDERIAEGKALYDN